METQASQIQYQQQVNELEKLVLQFKKGFLKVWS